MRHYCRFLERGADYTLISERRSAEPKLEEKLGTMGLDMNMVELAKRAQRAFLENKIKEKR
jgi:hypothetical protein